MELGGPFSAHMRSICRGAPIKMSAMIIGRRMFTVLPFFGMAGGRPRSRNAPIDISYDGTKAPKKLHRLLAAGYVNAVAWNGDGSRLAVLSDFGRTMDIWEAASWTVSKSFHRYGGGYSGNSLAFLPDGTLLTSAPIGRSPDPMFKTLAIFSLIQWNPDTGHPLRYIPDPGGLPAGMASKIGPADPFVVSADGSLVAGSCMRNVLLYNTHDWSLVRRLMTPPTPKHGDFVRSLAISPDNRHLALGTGFGWVHLFGLPDCSIIASFQVYNRNHDPAHKTRIGGSCGALSFSQDGEFLAIGRGGFSLGEIDDGWTQIWNVRSRVIIARLLGGGGSVRGIAWSRESNLLAVGDELLVRFWSTRKLPQPPRLLERISNRSYSLAFSSAGMLAVSDANEVVVYR